MLFNTIFVIYRYPYKNSLSCGLHYKTMWFKRQNSHTYGSKLWHLGVVNHRVMNAKAYRCHNRSKAYK